MRIKKKPSQDWLLIADGEPLTRDRLTQLAANRSVIVLDGAYEYVKSCGLTADILLGDFDSIKPEVLLQAKFSATQIIRVPDQNKTDLEKGILCLDELSAHSITLCAATGRRLQHTLYNLRLLKKFHKTTRLLQLFTEDEWVGYVEDEEVKIHGKINNSVGILGFPQARITTSGLKYDVRDYPLFYELAASVANALAEEQASIKVQGAALIIQENIPVPL